MSTGAVAKVYIKKQDTDFLTFGAADAATATSADRGTAFAAATLGTGVGAADQRDDFVELCVVEITRNSSVSEADSSDRCGNGFRSAIQTLRELSLDLTAVKKKNADGTLAGGLDILQDAYFNGDVISVVMLDAEKDVDGADGIVLNAQVFDLTEEQPLEDVIKLNVTLKNTGASVNPAYRINYQS